MNPVTARRTKPVSDRWAEIRGEPSQDSAALQASIDRLHAIVFDTPDGRELLNYLRHITIERRDPPFAVDGALRESEACRRFVTNLELRAARYWQQLAQRPTGKDAGSGS